MPSAQPLPPALVRYARRFDQGEYWIAHEELEALWLEDRRDLYKGLIHLAAGCLHLERGNSAGALTKISSAADLIAGDAALTPEVNAADIADYARSMRDTLVADKGAGVRPPCMLEWLGVPESGPLEPAHLPYRVRRYDQGYRPGRRPDRRD